MSNVLDTIYQLPIYQHFESVCSTEKRNDEIVMVRKNIEKCIPSLDLYYKTFHTYTLHNIQHQVNILRLIGDILGEENLKKLSALEAALLILAACYHDIGMVFKDDELKAIANEKTFHEFLEKNYRAKLIFEQNGQALNIDLAEWYCRWMHASRVWQFLKDHELQWDKVSLKKTLGDICESHGENAAVLVDDKKFDTDFQRQADTRFCAVLLRLADILDFDNSRTPKSVYELLELDTPKNHLEVVSKQEWQKHLASNGFKFSSTTESVVLSFSAGPRHPEVEKNIQKFLNIIESEVENCNGVLEKCSARWRDFKISPHIDRKNIISQNYKKGDYRLSLDEKQIITLLTGENLYNSSFEFIRELLQNAIDASRMREFHERYRGNSAFKAAPVYVTSWIDSQGFRWVRVDDQGMGLNEYIIENHLLKKGNSFYKSDYFKLLQFEYLQKTGKTFTPISRFGIGLLSCFILGDKVEITSRSIALPVVAQAEQSIRLSLDGLGGNYILQTEAERHDPEPFPSEKGAERGFRTEFGSSVAVRINGSRDYLGFEDGIKKMLIQHVTCSPVDIFYNGEKLGLDFKKTLITPFTSHIVAPFSDEDIQQLSKELGIKIDGKVNLEIIGVDVTKDSTNPNLQGQVCILRLLYDDKVFDQSYMAWRFGIQVNGRKYIEFKRTIRDGETHKEKAKTFQIEISEIFDKHLSHVDLKGIFYPQATDDSPRELNGTIKVIHNGINVPNIMNRNQRPCVYFRECFAKETATFGDSHQAAFGIIYLQDDLIPDLSVSRDIMQRIGFNIYSSLYYATRTLNNYIEEQYYFDYLEASDRFFSESEIFDDYNFSKGYWNSIPLIYTQDGRRCSIDELKKEFKGKPIAIWYPPYKPFLSALVKGLLLIHFDLQYVYGPDKRYNLIINRIKSTNTTLQPGTERGPLVFVEFDNDTLISHGGYVNKNHKLVKWILSNEQILTEKFENYFGQMMNGIFQKQVSLVNNILAHLRRSSLLDVPKVNISNEDFTALEEDLF